jgi:hypothetical protein
MSGPRNSLSDLEAIVDRIGPKATVELLALICEEKAEHVMTNWQDQILAAAWRRNSRTLDKTVHKIEDLSHRIRS